jgi:carbon monoxide dehydrogenase subunit G
VEWEGEFKVPGRPEDVIIRFADVERMARCVPGASLEGRGEDGSYLGSITVAFGPKRIVFRGKATTENDPAALQGSLTGQGAADMRAARFKVRVTYKLRADPDATAGPRTIVALRSDADLQGVIADFARTGGNAVAKVFMEDFSRRIADDFTAEMALPGQSSIQSAQAAPLSAYRLLCSIVSDTLLQIWTRIKRFVSVQ